MASEIPLLVIKPPDDDFVVKPEDATSLREPLEDDPMGVELATSSGRTAGHG